MAAIPCNNYKVGEAINKAIKNQVETLVTSDILTPVLLVNPADSPAQVQPSFPKPNSKQTLMWAYINITATGQYQVSTPTTSLNVYYVGAFVTATSSTLCGVEVFDGASGSAPSPAANTLVKNTSASFARFLTNAVGATQSNLPSLPVKVTNGIRIDAQSGSVDVRMIVFYIEESV